MKRLGTAAMIMAAFIGGMAFVYSCGGSGGSESNAQDLAIIESKIDALALYVENMDAKLDSLVLSFDNMEVRVDSIDATTLQTQLVVNATSTQVGVIQSTVNSIKSVVDAIKSFLGA